jgi:hypothetical protein
MVEQKDEVLNYLANREVNVLGRGNKEWTAANPNWRGVVARVKADIEPDFPDYIADLKQNLADALEALSERSQSQDIQTILDYYKTPAGRRYRQFIDQTHSLKIGKELFSAGGRKDSPSKERFEKYVKIIFVVPYLAAIAAKAEADNRAGRDTSGYGGVVGFIIMPPILGHQAELDSLDAEYSNDLADFESFVRSEPEQRFLAAWWTTVTEWTEKENDLTTKWLQRESERHGEVWNESYRAAIGQ